MLKKLFAGLLVSVFFAANLPNAQVNAINNPIIIDNILDFCLNLSSHGHRINQSGSCEEYTNTQTSVTIGWDTTMLYISDNLVLKNLELTFERPYSPFVVLEGGSLTIDGGHYMSPNCVIWIQYDNSVVPEAYVPSTFITIKSGVFEASLSSDKSTEAPSPVCLTTYNKTSAEEADRIIANYLPEGRRFVNLATRSVINEIPVSDGYAYTDKNQTNRDSIEYLMTTRVAVVEDEGLGSEEQPDEQLMETEREETEDVILEEQEEAITQDEEIIEEEVSKTDNNNLPKAPNTGAMKEYELDTDFTILIGIFVIFTVVIFTTCYRGRRRNNR